MNYRSLRIHDNVDYLLNVRAVDLAVVVHVGLLGSRAATDRCYIKHEVKQGCFHITVR